MPLFALQAHHCLPARPAVEHHSTSGQDSVPVWEEKADPSSCMVAGGFFTSIHTLSYYIIHSHLYHPLYHHFTIHSPPLIHSPSFYYTLTITLPHIIPFP